MEEERNSPRASKRVNRWQRAIVLVGAALLLTMVMFPPFYFRVANGIHYNLGYGFLFSPPTMRSGGPAGSVNIALLLLQSGVVATVVGALAWVLRDWHPSIPPIPRSWLIAAGVAIAVVVIVLIHDAMR